jgi:hypothetical protein
MLVAVAVVIKLLVEQVALVVVVMVEQRVLEAQELQILVAVVAVMVLTPALVAVQAALVL